VLQLQEKKRINTAVGREREKTKEIYCCAPRQGGPCPGIRWSVQGRAHSRALRAGWIIRISSGDFGMKTQNYLLHNLWSDGKGFPMGLI